MATAERWLAPVLNYIPAPANAAAAVDDTGMPPLAPTGELRLAANDTSDSDALASHPAGCNCAVHLAWRKPKVAAK